MKYGIITDIHGNYEALKVVLKYLKKKENVDAYLCCGDIVGYGPKPNKCIKAIMKLNNCHAIMGNHDYGALNLEETKDFNERAKKAIEWTSKKLKKKNKEYLKALGIKYENEKYVMFHGSPRDPVNEYMFNRDVFKLNIPLIKANICFVGHTHVPVCFCAVSNENIKILLFEEDKKVDINSEYKYSINMGSVGQPRDGDNRACVGIYDDMENTIELKRLKYNVAKTKSQILRAKLPEYLAKRLLEGK